MTQATLAEATTVEITENAHFSGTWVRSGERDAFHQSVWYRQSDKRRSSHPLLTSNIERLAKSDTSHVEVVA